MSDVESGFERILEYLRQSRGFDFTAYKRTSLMRRVRKRMQAVDIDGFDDYLDFLQVHPDEFSGLFNTILINVTSFFRDADVWQSMKTRVLPELLASGGSRPIRVWSAGCASGQEAYSAAILLAEHLGVDAFRERVKIYATDVDDEALGDARRAVYHARQLTDMPPDLLGRYFSRNGNELYSFDRDVRRSVIFGRHDLIQDAPISRVDLLLCRNTLMYFNSDAQARIMARFYFSVNSGGYLVLGRAEMLFGYPSMFQPVDLKQRVFTAAPKVNHRDRLQLLASTGREDIVNQYPNHARLRDLAFEASPDPQIVLDLGGTVVAVNETARAAFRVADRDLGSPLQDLEVSYRPVELRGMVDRARSDVREIAMRGVPWEKDGAIRFLDVLAVPLLDEQRNLVGIRVSYTDVTPIKSLQEELSHSKQELETAYEELQSTNEELETTNEELQSTVEELETTNEELQSTNEELETMNEELQSTNEELQTMNDELRNRSTELNSTNVFLEAVFTSLSAAVVVLNREMQVQVWNAGALEMWGVRPEEAQGSSFFTLDIGLPVGELHQPIREVLLGAAQRETLLKAINRKGRGIQCRVAISPLVARDRSITGVILLIEEDGPST